MMFNFFKKYFKKEEDDIQKSLSSSHNSLLEETQKTIEVAQEISNYLSYKNDSTDNKMKLVCNLLSCQVIIVDGYNKIHFINEYAKNKFDLTLQECNLDFFDIFNFGDFKNIKDLFDNYNDKKFNSSDYYTIKIKNKNYNSILRMSTINEINHPLYAIVMLDVTQRIDYEKELVKTRDVFKMFSDISNDIIVQTNNEGKIIQFNRKFSKLFPAEKENINTLLHDLPNKETYNKFETVFEKNGRYIPVIINKRKLKIEEEILYFYVIRDITAFKSAKEIIENKAERFHELLSYSYVSLVCFDENYTIKYFNDTFLHDFDINLPDNPNILNVLSEEDKGPFMRDIKLLNDDNPVTRSLHLFNGEYKDWIVFRKVKNGTIEYQCSIRDVTSYFKNT